MPEHNLFWFSPSHIETHNCQDLVQMSENTINVNMIIVIGIQVSPLTGLAHDVANDIITKTECGQYWPNGSLDGIWRACTQQMILITVVIGSEGASGWQLYFQNWEICRTLSKSKTNVHLVNRIPSVRWHAHVRVNFDNMFVLKGKVRLDEGQRHTCPVPCIFWLGQRRNLSSGHFRKHYVSGVSSTCKLTHPTCHPRKWRFSAPWHQNFVWNTNKFCG